MAGTEQSNIAKLAPPPWTRYAAAVGIFAGLGLSYWLVRNRRRRRAQTNNSERSTNTGYSYNPLNDEAVGSLAHKHIISVKEHPPSRYSRAPSFSTPLNGSPPHTLTKNSKDSPLSRHHRTSPSFGGSGSGSAASSSSSHSASTPNAVNNPNRPENYFVRLNRSTMNYIFRVAKEMRNFRAAQTSPDGPSGWGPNRMFPNVPGRKSRKHPFQNLLRGFVLASLFYEPSTRTSCSFEAAMKRLGGEVISINNIKSSSVSKGETLEDTIRTLQSYCDAVVLRHPEVGSAERATRVAKVPIINAGDGAGEHPTQALLDAFTIISEFDHLDDLTIAMAGDLRHGRTVHSLTRLLKQFTVKLLFVSPESLTMPAEVLKDLPHETPFSEHRALEEVIDRVDVLYMTRIQRERFDDPAHFDAVKDSLCVTPELMKRAKRKMIVMHPLPRVNEIDPQVDYDPRAAYFRQMQNGLYVRMALLAMVLGRA